MVFPPKNKKEKLVKNKFHNLPSYENLKEPGTFTSQRTSLTLNNHGEMSKKTRNKEDTRLLLQIDDYAFGKKKWN